MKLIDADALIPMLRYATIESEIGVFPIRIGFNAIKRVVDDAPTVDAIPIKYIEEWISEKMGYSVRNGKVFTVMILEKLIEDWREKNGNDN